MQIKWDDLSDLADKQIKRLKMCENLKCLFKVMQMEKRTNKESSLSIGWALATENIVNVQVTWRGFLAVWTIIGGKVNKSNERWISKWKMKWRRQPEWTKEGKRMHADVSRIIGNGRQVNNVIDRFSSSRAFCFVHTLFGCWLTVMSEDCVKNATMQMPILCFKTYSTAGHL